MDPNQIQPTQQPVINQAPVNPVPAVNPMTGNPVPQNQPTPPKKSGINSLVLVLILIFIIFVGIMAYIFMSGVKSSKTQTSVITPSRVVTPTPTAMPQTPAEEVQNIDVGNIDTDLNNINQDLQRL